MASAGPAVIAGYDVALGRQVKGRDVTSRTSYVIARDGRIAFVHGDMNPAEHVALTLAAVQQARRGVELGRPYDHCHRSHGILTRSVLSMLRNDRARG